MNILIVARGIPSIDSPMNGIFEWDQARALHNMGNTVTFVVLDLRSIRRKRRLRSHIFPRDGINVLYGSVPLGIMPASIIYNLGRWGLRRLLKIAISKFGMPDVIHGHFTDIGAIAAYESKNLGIPCIVTEHSSAMNLDRLSYKTIYFAKRAYRDATKIIAVSERLKNRIKQHFNTDSIVIPNIVDVDSIKFSPSKKRTLKKVLFVSTGSLLALKGHDLLVSSFANLPRNKAELLIIGEGRERKNLENQIQQLGLMDSVKLIGFKSRKEMSEIYSKADCFVLASRNETFGVVYIEAMLAGLPVIATRCGGPEDFVNESNGILVNPNNVTQLSDALLSMIDRVHYYSSLDIHQNSLSAFGPKSVGSKLIKVYNSAL